MRKVIISMAISLVVIAVITNVNAATTFLPDWMETEPEFEINYDDPMCDESGLFHKASGCPQPKVFDKYCPYDSDWISECYCPSVFSQICSYPYIGDTRVTDSNSGYASCDGLWVACCNSSCPSGTSRTNPGGCGGSTYNDCGDICYYPYEECCTPASSETGCTCGTYSCSDGCGGTRTCCSSCPTSDDTIDDGTDNTDDTDGTDNTDDEGTDEEDACTPLSNETSCSYGTESCSDGCGGTRTCCKAAPSCTPLSNETGCSYGTESCSDGCGGTRTCCKAAPSCTPLSNETGCSYGTESCSDGCGGTRTCCKSDPCAGVTCPTAKSCDYDCASYSTATSCCSSVCTSCKTKCEANPCAPGCYTDLSCTHGCASTNSCGGC